MSKVPRPDYRRALTLEDLDDHGCLKVSLSLWLVMVYLSRHAVLLLLGAASSFTSFTYGQRGSSYAGVYSDPWFLLASAPALLVLAAAIRRTPSAPAFLRAAWRHGRILLLTAVVLDLGILGLLVGAAGRPMDPLHGAQVLADLVSLMLLLSSHRLRDIFADFPQPIAGSDAPN